MVVGIHYVTVNLQQQQQQQADRFHKRTMLWRVLMLDLFSPP
jgi:hypothetical protein